MQLGSRQGLDCYKELNRAVSMEYKRHRRELVTNRGEYVCSTSALRHTGLNLQTDTAVMSMAPGP